jgi:Uma2 family endonuclease
MMIQTLPKVTTFDEFVEFLPENSGVRYELLKFADYEEMGIAEYWIIDYAALGGRKFIGNPKQSTISVCNLVDGEYQISKFQNNDRLISQIFPELNLTANQIFTAGLPN